MLSERRVAYLDLTGSGVETIAHLRQNGRIVLTFMSFERRPTIVRLHGRGVVVQPGDDGFDSLAEEFAEHPGVRAVIVVDIDRVADSCGYAVPLMDHVADREVLDLSNSKKGPEGLAQYRAQKNAVSLDGLAGLPGLGAAGRRRCSTIRPLTRPRGPREPPYDVINASATRPASARARSAGYSGSRSSHTTNPDSSSCRCPSGRAKNRTCRWAPPPMR